MQYMNKTNILIVEDEPKIREGLKDFLEFHDFRVQLAQDGPTADNIVTNKGGLDLILLDLMLPGISGEELCIKWRQDNCQTPIIMLTAKGQENQKIQGLNIGADDYITKPFSLEELLARINAILRRIDPSRSVGKTFVFGNFNVNLSSLTITHNATGKDTIISKREGAIIQYFSANPNRIVTRDELYTNVWGETITELGTRTVDMHIAKLRSKIQDETISCQLIQTVRGSGYKYSYSV